MASLGELLSAKKFMVFADLGANSLELARMAQESGADAVIAHVNSGIDDEPYTGPPELEIPIISEIAASISIPIGLALGGRRQLIPPDLETIRTVSPLFITGLAHHLPAWLISQYTTDVVLVVGAGYSLEQIETMEELSGVRAVALKIQGSGIQSSISTLDLSTTRVLAKRLSKPLFLWPRAGTEDATLGLLSKLGCRGIIEPISSTDLEDSKYRIMKLKEAVQRLTN